MTFSARRRPKGMRFPRYPVQAGAQRSLTIAGCGIASGPVLQHDSNRSRHPAHDDMCDEAADGCSRVIQRRSLQLWPDDLRRRPRFCPVYRSGFDDVDP